MLTTRTVFDRERRCVQCFRAFIWTAGEQRFYADKGFPPPRRCPKCREWNRRLRAEGGVVRLPEAREQEDGTDGSVLRA